MGTVLMNTANATPMVKIGGVGVNSWARLDGACEKARFYMKEDFVLAPGAVLPLPWLAAFSAGGAADATGNFVALSGGHYLQAIVGGAPVSWASLDHGNHLIVGTNDQPAFTAMVRVPVQFDGGGVNPLLNEAIVGLTSAWVAPNAGNPISWDVAGAMVFTNGIYFRIRRNAGLATYQVHALAHTNAGAWEAGAVVMPDFQAVALNTWLTFKIDMTVPAACRLYINNLDQTTVAVWNMSGSTTLLQPMFAIAGTGIAIGQLETECAIISLAHQH
jgi:hypothetical protein